MRVLEVNQKFTPIDTRLNDVYHTFGLCDNFGGKMFGMSAVSTCCACNAHCKKMHDVSDPECVCTYCYADDNFKGYKGSAMLNKYSLATENLTSHVYSFDEIPYLDYTYVKNMYGVFRVEAFGELNDIKHGGLNQAINYINLILKNEHINFGWWTKRPEIIDKAFKKLGISCPENVNIIYSSYYLNNMHRGRKENIKRVLEKYSFISGVFTVYTAEYAIEHDIKINCGSANCLNCLKCYNAHNEIFYINEIKKDDAHLYYKTLAALNAC